MVGTTRTLTEVRDGRVVAGAPIGRVRSGRESEALTVEGVFGWVRAAQQRAAAAVRVAS